MLVLLVARYLSELKSEQLELRDLLKLGGLVALAYGAGDDCSRISVRR